MSNLRHASSFLIFLALAHLSTLGRSPASDLVVATGAGNDIVTVGLPAGGAPVPHILSGTGGMSQPAAVAYGPDGYLYAISGGSDEVLRFTPDGGADCGYQWPVIPGFTGLSDILFDPVDGDMLVSGRTCGRVVRVNPTTGAWSDEFSAHADGLQEPMALSIHPLTGELLVADFAGDQILRLCNTGGAELCALVSAGLSRPAAMVWQNNELYVLNTGTSQVLRFGASGNPSPLVLPLGTEVPPPAQLSGLEFGPNGRLHVGDRANGRVLIYGVAATVPLSSYVGVLAAGVDPVDFAVHAPPEVPFPLPVGTLVTTYCPNLVNDPLLGPHPDPTKPALYAVDPRAGGPLGRNWLAPKFWNADASQAADIWNAANLGPVFGICLDRIGNVYLTATTAYGCFDPAVYPAGPGAVYKIDGATGAISVWLGTNPVPSVPLASTPGTTTLPNTGPGLGDITYNPVYDQFFVSNLEDGRIYSVKDTPSGGQVLRAFDPFGNDEVIDGTPGFPALGERVYAVHCLNGRILLWSAWLRDRLRPLTSWPTTWPALPPGTPPNNAVYWSHLVSIQGEGVIQNYALWKVMPWIEPGVLDYSNPVTDITDNELSSGPFMNGSRILLAERSYNSDCGHIQDGDSAHQSRVLEFLESAGFPWSGRPFLIGDERFSPKLRNSAGGVAYALNDDVWATGDALDLHYDTTLPSWPPCHVAYGLERIPSTGNAYYPETAYSLLIDLDEYTAYYNKSQTGDVELVEFPFNDWGDVDDVCSGDVWSSCPCANPGLSGHGCANSLHPEGAHLVATGLASISADTIRLQAAAMPNSTALYFQGTTALGGGAGVPFGDGLRCAGGTTIRLAIKVNIGGASEYPGPGDAFVSVRGLVPPGAYRTYQVWYRNAGAFCTASTFNLSNAIGLSWNP